MKLKVFLALTIIVTVLFGGSVVVLVSAPKVIIPEISTTAAPPLWSILTIDSVGDVGYFTSIALDSQNNPHIGYYDKTNSGLKYANYTGTAWNIETVTSVGDYGKFASIALDSQNNPHIAYVESLSPFDDRLRYAEWTGSAWSIETVDSQIGGISWPSLALDSDDHPHISYQEEAIGVPPPGIDYLLKYAEWTGTTWSIQFLDSPHAGFYSSLALDSNDYPHISYYEGIPFMDVILRYCLKYAEWTGTTWSIETVDPEISLPGEVSYTSLALDSDGHPHISYLYVSISGGLKYAEWTGTTWSIETVDSVGLYSSLALDSNGYPHVSYYNITGGDLKYAEWTGSAWSIGTVDSDGDVGSYTSIALDSQDRPHISYYDVSNGDLKYAAATRAFVDDVAVTDVNVGKTWVYHGFSAEINVTVLNNGDGDENVNVTLYYNVTDNKIIGTQNVTLSPKQNQTITFTWDTTGVPYPRNYTITANATIPSDNNLSDNTLTDGTIEVRIPGDINGDGSVNLLDVIEFGNHFGLPQGDIRWDPDADMNQDGKVNIIDMIILGQWFGKSGSQ